MPATYLQHSATIRRMEHTFIEWRDTLALVAEVSIAVVGFAGLINVFTLKNHPELAEKGYARLRFMLDYALFALAGAFIPLLVFSSGIEPGYGWRICAGLLGLILAVYWGREGAHMLQVFRTADAWFRLLISSDIVALIILVLLVVSNWLQPPVFWYLVPVCFFLLGAVIGFVRIILLLFNKV